MTANAPIGPEGRPSLVIVVGVLVLLALFVYWPFASWRKDYGEILVVRDGPSDVFTIRDGGSYATTSANAWSGLQAARPYDVSGCVYLDGWHPDSERACADIKPTVSNRWAIPPLVVLDNSREIVRVMDEQNQRFVDVWTVDRRHIRVDRKTGKVKRYER